MVFYEVIYLLPIELFARDEPLRVVQLVDQNVAGFVCSCVDRLQAQLEKSSASLVSQQQSPKRRV